MTWNTTGPQALGKVITSFLSCFIVVRRIEYAINVSLAALDNSEMRFQLV